MSEIGNLIISWIMRGITFGSIIMYGALGEIVDYRLCLTVCGAATMAVCWLTVWRRRKDVRKLYEYEVDTEKQQ